MYYYYYIKLGTYHLSFIPNIYTVNILQDKFARSVYTVYQYTQGNTYGHY